MSAAAVLLPDETALAPDALPTILAPSPVPTFAVQALVEPEFWDQIPADVPELLALLPAADLYVQDEVDIRHHPTLTRVWSAKGHHGQRQVRAPGNNQRAVAFVALDWRDGWCSHGFGFGRTADRFVAQLDHLVARSQSRGRCAVVLTDNAKIHTPHGAKLVRAALARHGPNLRLVNTPAYDPAANPTERLFPPFRRAVTHNHRRAQVVDLYRDAQAFFAALDACPQRALRHIGSPFALQEGTLCSVP